jgi:nitroimidazol reductase NimA-like FMN-containing flavoprotein (pyridoxamine 5'-phosphate oxidase superfamily)
MRINEQTKGECGTALEEAGFRRLACVRGDQPYIVPSSQPLSRQFMQRMTFGSTRITPAI